MKHFWLLTILPVILLFASCDGRDKAYASPKEAIENSDLPTSFFEKTEYFPSEYTEVVTDTILSNGYRVEIKTFSDMQNSYVKEFVKDTIKYKHHYRDFLSSISIYKDGKELFYETVDKDFFEASATNRSFLKETTFHNVWLDEQTSTFTDTIVINSLFCKPKTNDCIVYKMTIDKTGYLTITEDASY